MSGRCDGIPQCVDKSDEDECYLFTIDKGMYNRKYPPRDYQELDVKVQVMIRSIHQLNELDMTFISKITLSLEWYDNRVTFFNLKQKDFTNLIEHKKTWDIWTPPLVFNNTKEDVKVKTDRKADFFVNRRGLPTMARRSLVNEDYIYPGSDNVFVYRRTYEMRYSCVYHLEAYPFDTQNCQIEVSNNFMFKYL